MRSCKEEEKEEAQEEERRGQWQQNADCASESPRVEFVPEWSVS